MIFRRGKAGKFRLEFPVCLIVWCVLLMGLSLQPATVSASDSKEKRFKINPDGTVTDLVAGLVWASADNGGDMGFSEARQWVAYTYPMTLSGSDPYDWRLPTIDEVRELYNASVMYGKRHLPCGMSIPMIPQISLSCGWIWVQGASEYQLLLFNFQYGSIVGASARDTHNCRALPVRTLADR